MHLENLALSKFRCIDHFESDLPKGPILIVGDNAQGKTTLLEAIFYLVTGRSFRTRFDSECIPWGAPPETAALMHGRVRRVRGDSCRLSVNISHAAKAVQIDNRPLERLGELWGQLRAALFTPDDLSLIKGGPGQRRHYLDIGLSQIDAKYLYHLQRYSQALRQRNALLRQKLTMTELRQAVLPWDYQLVENGVPVLKTRMEYVAAIEPVAGDYYHRIASSSETPEHAGGETLKMDYQSTVRLRSEDEGDDLSAAYLAVLERSLEEDLRRLQTSVGPHRDDFSIRISGKAVRDYGSQGQVRSCVLALRLAEVSEMKSRTGEPPILLLDDLASELDPGRKERVLKLVQPEAQTFMTTTRRQDFPPDSEFAKIIHLPGGA